MTLEPNANPTVRTYQDALFQQGIPITAFEVDDITSGCAGSAFGSRCRRRTRLR